MRILCKAPKTIHPKPLRCCPAGSGRYLGPAVSVEREHVPGDAVPGDAVPGNAVPGDAVPGDAVPGNAVPGNAVPGEVIPGDAVPGQGVPGKRRPENAAEERIPPLQRRAKKDRSEEHTSELQSPCNLVCRLLLEKKEIQTPW